MDCYRICTQHYIDYYIFNGEQVKTYIGITSKINRWNLPHSHTSGDWLLKPLLPFYESPQKSLWCIVTFLKENGLKSQAIWSQHDQKSTLIHYL
jgi:hypothetical protein